MSLGSRFQQLSCNLTSFRQEHLNRDAIRKAFREKILPEITLFACAMTALGSMILAFGLYHVHAYSGITEGGVLGLVLLLQYWLDLSPALSGPVINTACFVLGWKVLGCRFVIYSALASLAFSLAWAGCELMDPLWPALADQPLLAALAGALFVGVGCGLCIRTGGATGGDDALAMALTEIVDLPSDRYLGPGPVGLLHSAGTALLFPDNRAPFRPDHRLHLRSAPALAARAPLHGQLIEALRPFFRTGHKLPGPSAAWGAFFMPPALP